MYGHFTRLERRRLRELAGRAYDRGLERELGHLWSDFEAWHRDEINPHELSERIQRFHDGTARDLYASYRRGDPALVVAAAYADGRLSREEIGGELLGGIRDLIEHDADRAALEPPR